MAAGKWSKIGSEHGYITRDDTLSIAVGLRTKCARYYSGSNGLNGLSEPTAHRARQEMMGHRTLAGCCQALGAVHDWPWAGC